MRVTFRQRLLATTIAGAAIFAQPAFAQTQPPASPDEPRPAEDVQIETQETVPDSQGQTEPGEEIVVTGTLIRNPNLVQSAPVTSVGEAEIELSQANVAEELLRELPAAVPSVGSQVNNGNGGASFVNLRGLGTNRNLVLLDGKRLVPAGLGGVVDLNNIPLSLLERVDVLTGGASTTYGADAVTGVVNFITKRDFAGADISLSNTITERGDGNIIRADLTLGANFDDGRGNAVLALGYQEADPVFQGDRDFAVESIDSVTGGAGGSGTTVPVRVSIPGTGIRQLDPATGAFVPTFAFFNFNPQNIFQTPFERFNIFGQANYELFEGVELYTEGLFSKNTVGTRIASSGTFGTPLSIEIGNPFLPTAAARQLFNAIDTDPATPGIQPGTEAQFQAARAGGAVTNRVALTTPVLRRFVEFGTRNSDFTSTVFNVQAGIRGDITDVIGFDVFGSYGESENIQRQSGQGLRSRLVQAADVIRDPATGEIRCRNTANNCTPINLFGPAGSISQDAFNFLNVSTSASTLTSLSTVRGVISGDTPLRLFSENPAGFAIGAEYRRYTAGTSSDVANQTPGEVLGNGAASPDVRGQFDVKEAFAELILPIIEDRPGFHSLQLELGGRVSDYSTSGTSYTYKVGAQYEPVDGFKFRGGYNRATRSPNVGELFGPLVTGLDNLATDPCQGNLPLQNANLRAVCLAQGAPASAIGTIAAPSAGQINVTGGGNQNLDVEVADTYTIGAVLTPNFLRGFVLSVDYFNIKVEDAISSPTVGDVIRACFGTATISTTTAIDPGAGAATNPACTGIRRNPLTGGLDGDVATTPGLPVPLSNLGRLETSGIDVVATYRTDLPFGGFLTGSRLNLSFNGVYTDKQIFQASPSSPAIDCVGFYGVECPSPQPEFAFTQRSTLTVGGSSLSLLWRYIGDLEVVDGLDAGFLPEFSRISDKNYFDLSFRQQITDDMNFIFTVQNLLDKDPPVVGNSIGSTAFNSGNTYPSTFDPLGRRYTVQVNLRF
jgi:iron complex outermembrane recepter protein